MPRNAREAVLFAVLAGLAVAVFVAAAGLFRAADLTTTTARARLYREGLDAALQRHAHLPFVLATDPLIRAGAEGRTLPALNARLRAVADRTGLTIAASNHDAPVTFLGANYGFRPYFSDALAGETVPVTNRDGIVILTSEPALEFQPIARLSAERLADIRVERLLAAPSNRDPGIGRRTLNERLIEPSPDRDALLQPFADPQAPKAARRAFLRGHPRPGRYFRSPTNTFVHQGGKDEPATQPRRRRGADHRLRIRSCRNGMECLALGPTPCLHRACGKARRTPRREDRG